jgi:hypothetical protein
VAGEGDDALRRDVALVVAAEGGHDDREIRLQPGIGVEIQPGFLPLRHLIRRAAIVPAGEGVRGVERDLAREVDARRRPRTPEALLVQPEAA